MGFAIYKRHGRAVLKTAVLLLEKCMLMLNLNKESLFLVLRFILIPALRALPIILENLIFRQIMVPGLLKPRVLMQAIVVANLFIYKEHVMFLLHARA